MKTEQVLLILGILAALIAPIIGAVAQEVIRFYLFGLP